MLRRPSIGVLILFDRIQTRSKTSGTVRRAAGGKGGWGVISRALGGRFAALRRLPKRKRPAGSSAGEAQ
jgi:hypothetical protein